MRRLIDEMAARCERVGWPGEFLDDVRAVSANAAGRPARRTRKPIDVEKKKRREDLLEMFKEVRDEELETSRKRFKKQEEGREDEKGEEGTVEQEIPGKMGAVTVDKETTADAENGG